MVIQPSFLKLDLYVKHESCMFKIERVMAIFVDQGETKSKLISGLLTFNRIMEQAGADLGQAQLKLGLDFNFWLIWFLWI